MAKQASHETAFCFRDGVIAFARRCPKGALPLGRGPKRRIRSLVEVLARRSYPGTGRVRLLVPGVPEACDDDDGAMVAARWFADCVAHKLAGKTGWPPQPAGYPSIERAIAASGRASTSSAGRRPEAELARAAAPTQAVT